MNAELVSCHELSIGHTEPLRENLNFKLCIGDIFLLKGKNGSGKSTLIKTIMGEVVPLSGVVKKSLKSDEISYLPQLISMDGHFSYKIQEILDLFDVPEAYQLMLGQELLDKRWADGSGGEKQKALILTRIKLGTKLLILDEPFNHLDDEAINESLGLIKRLVDDGVVKALVLVSHIPLDRIDMKFREMEL